MKNFIPILLISFCGLFGACASGASTEEQRTKEKVERTVNQMDSISQDLEKGTRELKERAKALEKNLEELLEEVEEQ